VSHEQFSAFTAGVIAASAVVFCVWGRKQFRSFFEWFNNEGCFVVFLSVVAVWYMIRY
jgi:hypothetical protein